MSINIESYEFEGPFRFTFGLRFGLRFGPRNESGVYAILGQHSINDRWRYAILGQDSVNDCWSIVDIGESEYVRSRVENHNRKGCWRACGYTSLSCAAYYCGEIRHVIEKELRDILKPPCGER